MALVLAINCQRGKKGFDIADRVGKTLVRDLVVGHAIGVVTLDGGNVIEGDAAVKPDLIQRLNDLEHVHVAVVEGRFFVGARRLRFEWHKTSKSLSTKKSRPQKRPTPSNNSNLPF